MPCVYALIDPRDGQLRYVGKTVGDVGARLSSHLTPSRLKRNLHRAKWMASVVRDGVKPEVEVLEECPLDKLDEAERHYIAYFKGLGCQLTNATTGGDGALGWVRSPETVERHRLAMKKAYAKPDVMRRATEANRRKATSPEYRMKLSLAQGGASLKAKEAVGLCKSGMSARAAARALGIGATSVLKFLRAASPLEEV